MTETSGQPGIDSRIGLLPHGAAFRFITGLTHMEVGESRGFWELDGTEDFFTDHFPGNPILPGVLVIESLAQMSGLVQLPDEQELQGREIRLVHVDVRVDKTVRPPALIEVQSKLHRELGPLAMFEVEARVDGKPVARGTLSLQVRGADDQ